MIYMEDGCGGLGAGSGETCFFNGFWVLGRRGQAGPFFTPIHDANLKP